ncbi:MAG: UDP-N-acetylmuramoyl-L-alanyl-D-glutamate--2,6-diaminopimelate ligase [Acidimicrobiia bacterium]|nr:UDP-N-acetylmuramoyl-L-alanyl-D-glutamate--2,6-diaminopimelate ligase [Acidimicrobiia bacterium]
MTATIARVGQSIDAVLEGSGDGTLVGATHDSGAVEPGWLFCCVPGANVDGHEFAGVAIDAGASALLAERTVDDRVPQLIVADARSAMGPAAAEIYEHPSRELAVVGVTGTNGKSSVVQLIADIWSGAGHRAESYGTLTGARTTPEAPDLQRRLRESRTRGVEAVAIEVSSHALELHRVSGTRFAAAIFTNLGRDHLDFHHDMESYFRAKAALFDPRYTGTAVINVDDPYGRRLVAEVGRLDGIEVVPYELADAEGLVFDGPITRFTWQGHQVVLQLAGRHNVANALAAASAAVAAGIDTNDIADALCATQPVRGRFELIQVGQPFTLAVDYAHTPDALDAVLDASRQVAVGRVIVVFGCGGDRDQDKRPEMGLVVDRAADVAVVTSDNPRSEDPDRIIEDVVSGMTSGAGGGPAARIIVEPDRRKAIAAAVAAAGAGDLVLIAGKGHETVQLVGDREVPFDDRQVALEALGVVG